MNLALPADLPRMDPVLELALFRALQESLTNVYRYSGSPVVDIQMYIQDREVNLVVRDYGRGIPVSTLDQFRKNGSGVGVGLTAMRQRMEELGGELTISSDHNGTKLKATAPLSKKSEHAHQVA